MQRGGIFDIGGVIAHDVWESMYFDAKRGIAVEHHLDQVELGKIGKDLYRLYEHGPSRAECLHPELIERAYWQAFVDDVSEVFGLKLNVGDLVDLTDSFVTPIPEMIEVLVKLKERDIPMALCSNNNIFWFNRQWEKCELERYLDAGRAILSCDEGVSKGHPSGAMFKRAIAVTGLPAGALLYTDDRKENNEVAERFGLNATCFEFASPARLEQLDRIRHFLLGVDSE